MHICIHVCICTSLHLFLSVCSLYLYMYLYASVCTYLSIHQSINPSIHQSIHTSISVSLYLCISVSLYLCISVSLHVYMIYMPLADVFWDGNPSLPKAPNEAQRSRAGAPDQKLPLRRDGLLRWQEHRVHLARMGSVYIMRTGKSPSFISKSTYQLSCWAIFNSKLLLLVLRRASVIQAPNRPFHWGESSDFRMDKGYWTPGRQLLRLQYATVLCLLLWFLVGSHLCMSKLPVE